MTRALAALALALLLPASARAAPAPLRLDYRSLAPDCPSADRVADEVSARLGSSPWSQGGARRVTVRIAAEGDQRVATVELPDGGVRVLRAPSCAELGPTLVIALAVALDPAAEGPPTPPTARTAIVHVRAPGGPVRLAAITERGTLTRNSRTSERTSWRPLCVAPCTFEIEPGYRELVIDGEDTYRGLTLGQGHNYLVAHRRSPLVIAGATIGSIGLAAAVVGLAGLVQPAIEDGEIVHRAAGWAVPALLGGLAGVGVGIGMAAAGDVARIERDRAPGPAGPTVGASYRGTF